MREDTGDLSIIIYSVEHHIKYKFIEMYSLNMIVVTICYVCLMVMVIYDAIWTDKIWMMY